MHIAAVINSLTGGGAERTLTMLASEWAQHGHRVTIVTFQNQSAAEDIVQSGVMHHPLSSSSRGIGGALKTWWRLRKYLVKHQPDVIVSFMDQANILTLIAQWWTKTPVIISERIYPEYSSLLVAVQSGFVRWLIRTFRNIVYRRAQVLVVQTEQIADYFSKLSHVPTLVIPNPIVEPSSLGPPLELKKPTIIAIGRLVEQKRFDLLIDAFRQSNIAKAGWHLSIVGEGSLKDLLLQRIADLGLESSVYLLGRQTNIREILAQADIFVLCSDYEGFPVALGEAMIMKKAVIATDCPSGPRALIADNSCGLLVSTGSCSELSDALERLIKDPTLRHALGTAAERRAQEFSLSVIAERWLNVMKELR